MLRLAPVLKTTFHQYVISYDDILVGSLTLIEQSELDWLQLYDMTHC